MSLDLTINIGQLDRIETQLILLQSRAVEIARGQTELRDLMNATKVEIEMARADFDTAMADLQARVQRMADVEDSAVALIQGIATQLADALKAGDTAALQALSDKLNTDAEELAAAVAAVPPTPTP